MALPPGTKLGPYEIVAPLGAGGMGEVYRARDTRLDRTVAIKILPPHLSEDVTLRQRFEREAKTISRLNHPHICVLYDVGVQDGTHFLVMECVEGETLANRLEKGPLPLELVLKYGTQIADALDKAHRSGVMHRDLKPGNIMLTATGAKLLDFGLAKAAPALAVGATLSGAATRTTPVTQQGTIVGTFQYMSPEQVEGKEVDARSDIFSLGSVLYEMVTGQRAFPGKSQLSVASAILEKEPEAISKLQPLTPPALDHAIRRCLAKEPEKRWQSAADLAGELQWIAESGSQAGAPAPLVSQRKFRERVAWAAAAVFVMSTITLASILFLHAPKPAQPVRFLVFRPENSYINAAAHAAVSPDGRQLAFVASDSTGKDVLWVRSLDSLTARPLAGTEGAAWPFWSPDSRWIAFFASNALRKIDVTGGAPISIESVLVGGGGTWSRDGMIVFGVGATLSLYRVPASGGEAVPLTKREEGVSRRRRGAHFLPDGKHYLYDAAQTEAVRSVYVASLDSDVSKLVVQTATSPVYQQGYLLYLRGTTLIAQPFDEKRLEIIGDASALAEQVQGFSASQTGGVLAHWTGAGVNAPQLIWVDRRGKRIGLLGEPINQINIRISPDGTKVAAELKDPQVSLDYDIWIYDALRGVKTRLTSGPGSSRMPCWVPDGKEIIFSSNRKGNFNLYEKAIDGSGIEEPVLESESEDYCQSWSPDGKFLLFHRYKTTSGTSSAKAELWMLPLFGDRKPVPYLQTEFGESGGRFSPDGKWIAYTSNESGRDEVYVRPFPASGGKWMISTSGGSNAVWRRDGKEIFYLGPSGELMAAKVNQNGSALTIGVPSALFQAHMESLFPSYDASADGQRFLIATVAPQKLPSPITVVVNWDAGLKKQ